MKTKITITSPQNDQMTEVDCSDKDKPEVVTGDASRLADMASKKSVHAAACIYCGSTEGLSDEHVIPYAWGGNLQIFRGSCELCRQKTSAFENFALNDGAMAEVRMVREIQSRSDHSSARLAIKVILVKDGTPIEIDIATQNVPLILGFPWFARPGFLTEEGNSQLLLEGWVTTTHGPDVEAFLKLHGATELRVGENKKRQTAFAQTMAKIAYGYAWIDGVFENVEGGSELAKAFMSEPDQLGAFVGMAPPPFKHHSDLDFRLEYFLRAPELMVCMEVQPFPNVPAPTYIVVLGICRSLRSWRRIRRSIALGFHKDTHAKPSLPLPCS